MCMHFRFFWRCFFVCLPSRHIWEGQCPQLWYRAITDLMTCKSLGAQNTWLSVVNHLAASAFIYLFISPVQNVSSMIWNGQRWPTSPEYFAYIIRCFWGVFFSTFKILMLSSCFLGIFKNNLTHSVNFFLFFLFFLFFFSFIPPPLWWVPFPFLGRSLILFLFEVITGSNRIWGNF